MHSFITLSLVIALGFSGIVSAEQINSPDIQPGDIADPLIVNTLKAESNAQDLRIKSIEDAGSGTTVLNGTTDPLGTTGNDGDFYINTASNTLWGPKTVGAWSTSVSLVGPAGSGCSVIEENGGRYLRCDDGTTAQLSPPLELKIGTIEIDGDNKLVDIYSFGFGWEREVTSTQTSLPTYSQFKFVHRILSGDELFYVDSDIHRGTPQRAISIELLENIGAGARRTPLTITFQESLFRAKSQSAALPPTVSFEAPKSQWSPGPLASGRTEYDLNMDLDLGSWSTDCVMPTTFEIVGLGPGSKNTDILDVTWESVRELSQAAESQLMVMKHSNLELLPCLFKMDVGELTALTVRVDAATTLTLGGAVLAGATLDVSGLGQNLETKWFFRKITKSVTPDGGNTVSFCWDYSLNAACKS